jgi:hypothetical protein
MKVAAVAAAVVVLGLAFSAGVSSGSPSSPAYAKLCKPITGPRWTAPSGHGTASGNSYQIGVLDFSCAAATRYVKKFYLRRSAGSKKVLTGGPRGYVCRATSPKGLKAYQGSCKRKRGISILAAFAWAPRRS